MKITNINSLLLISSLLLGACSSDLFVKKRSGQAPKKPIPAEGISTWGRELYVDGKPFKMKGVCWNPVPKGSDPAHLLFNLYDQRDDPNYDEIRATVERDIKMMSEAGINYVRLYTPIESKAVLDLLHLYGMKVNVPFFNRGWGLMEEKAIRDYVRKFKDHPAILFYEVGNEWNYNFLYKSQQAEVSSDHDKEIHEAVEKISWVIKLIKEEDDKHPIASTLGDGHPQELIKNLPEVDMWGFNLYRGDSFYGAFNTFGQATAKPIFIGEYGTDAWNYDPNDSENFGRLALDNHAQTIKKLATELKNSDLVLGGAVFEWNDEWWKAHPQDEEGAFLSRWDIQDVTPERDENGNIARSGLTPDGVFNDEYFGLVTLGREARPALRGLREVYTSY